jgi:condensin complex subunit 2
MAAVKPSQKENRPAIAAHGPMFSSGELKTMLGQCLKMASENKITASNTWGLPLIEHLDDLIKEDDPNKHTNFQRASVTLDAGVKIYSYRVDSVHTETFKILGGLGRAAGPGEEGEGELGDGGVDGENISPSKRKRRGELNPEATLEPTLEALNVKKFDLAFAVDPLFHKTSAQFDEGGAKGLLLNNLSVYRGCEIVFDSMDVPEAAIDEADITTAVTSSKVDLDVVKPQLEAVLRRSRAVNSKEERLTPTLDDILSIIGSAPKTTAAADADEFVHSIAEGSFDAPLAIVSPKGIISPAGDVEGDEGADSTTAAEMMQTEEAAAPYGGDDDFGGGYDGGCDDYDDMQNQQQYCGDGGDVEMTQQEGFALAGEMPSASSSLQEDAISWLISAGNSNGTASGSSYVTASKGWAGASHWRYRAVPQGKDNINGTGEDGDEIGVDNAEFGRSKKRGGGGARKRNEPLDFVALMTEGAEEPEFEMLPRGNSGRRTASRTKKTAAKTLLPEDYHYTSEFLARYALRPRTAVAIIPSNGVNGNGGGDFTNNNYTTNGFNDFGSGFEDHGADDFGDDGNGGDAYGGEWDGGAFASLESEMDVGDDLDIAQASHRVEKVEVNYSRAAKQVDVRYLKELMWNGIQTVVAQHAAHGATKGVSPDDPIEFADILATVPENNPAGRLEDLSIHLCFICVLHLANEHGLVVRGVPELNKMQISNIVRVSVS